jgi:hypothetical protein
LLDKILIVYTGLTPGGYGGAAEACNIVGLERIGGEEGMQIYPNPFAGSFRVESGLGFSSLEILSMDGKILISLDYGKPSNNEELNLLLEA